jgi:hypothetical protein
MSIENDNKKKNTVISLKLAVRQMSLRETLRVIMKEAKKEKSRYQVQSITAFSGLYP